MSSTSEDVVIVHPGSLQIRDYHRMEDNNEYVYTDKRKEWI